jgi:putative DNA primase/helicase
MSGAANLRSLARALNGEISGDQILAPGPGHSARDRSLIVKTDPAAPGGMVVHSFAGDDPLRCKDYVRGKLGLDPDGWKRRSGSRSSVTRRGLTQSPSRDDNEGRTRAALTIWTEAKDPRGTLVEGYLKSRKLELPDELTIGEIRFHQTCPFGAERLPAMVCLVRNIRTNEPQAITEPRSRRMESQSSAMARHFA